MEKLLAQMEAHKADKAAKQSMAKEESCNFPPKKKEIKSGTVGTDTPKKAKKSGPWALMFLLDWLNHDLVGNSMIPSD